MYQIRYSRHFEKSLTSLITYWKNKLGFSDQEISNFVSAISKNINLLTEYPYLSQDVNQLYHFSVPTFRLMIGKQYSIFYRVDEKTRVVLIGNIFNSHQMRLKF